MSDNETRVFNKCILCNRDEEQAGKMIPVFSGVYVCADCMSKSAEYAHNMGLDKMFTGGFPDISKFTNTESAEQHKSEDKPTDNQSDETQAETIVPDGSLAAEGSQTVEYNPSKEEKAPEEETASGFSPFPGVSIIGPGNIMDMLGLGSGRKKVKKTGEHKPIMPLKDIPAPHKIKEQLDEYVIGQEKAKKIISVAVYNHYKRIAADPKEGVEIEKSNMLMIGPTGCGKTYLVKTLAKILDVPLAITDATSLTEAGYIGDDIESVVSKLLAAADNDVDRAEQGIIFIDEIDKIAKKHNHGSRDVNGEAVQQGMLRLLEGADVEVPVGASNKNAMVPMTTVNTRNILFICGGAFPELEDIIKQRLRKKTSIGYGAELKDKWDKEKNILGEVTTEDLRKFGMIPEFLGRLPVVYTLQGVTEDMLISILKEPRNAIMKQYERLLELDEVKLEFTEEALEAIAKKALEKEMGARALRSIIEELMLDIMYEVPKDDNIGKVTITKEYIEGTGGPIIDIRNTSVE